MANVMTMGDSASLSREGRGVIRQQGDTPLPDAVDIVAPPAPELVEVELAPAEKLPGVDLTNPVTARSEGLDGEMAVIEAPPALGGPAVARPAGPIIPERFDPREWTLIKGNWLSTPEPAAASAPAATVAATLGGILKDGFGRRVRSGTGSFVRTGRFGRE